MNNHHVSLNSAPAIPLEAASTRIVITSARSRALSAAEQNKKQSRKAAGLLVVVISSAIPSN
jgi:hypothetical protein